MQKCIKCGKDLQEKAISDINDAFSLIIERYGKIVFKEGNKLLGLLGDYAPNLAREHKLVKIAVESGAYKALYEADISEKKSIVNKYVSVLTESYFIDESWARKAMHWCLVALSMDVQKISIKSDDFQCVFELAQKTKAEGRIQEAVNLYVLVKDNSEYERKAQMCLAELYDGQAEKAFQCYHRAAVLGDARAQFLVGYMYEYGEGIGKQ